MNDLANKRNWLNIWLGILQVFIGVGAIPAGLSMIINPNGNELGMNIEMLANSPFPNFLIPGIFLLTINGVLSTFAGVLTFKLHRFSTHFAIGLGTFLILWIIAQIWWLGIHWLHVFYLILGIIELIFAIALRKQRTLQLN